MIDHGVSMECSKGFDGARDMRSYKWFHKVHK